MANSQINLEKKILHTSQQFSQWLDGVAEDIDLWLVGEKVTNRQNKTTLRISNTTSVKEREGVGNAGSFSLDLRLPNLEEYWNLKFTSYEDIREKRESQELNLQKRPPENNVGATIGLNSQLGKVKTRFQPRVQLTNPLNVSHSLLFETSADMGAYQVYPEADFFVNADDGAGVVLALNFHQTLDESFGLRWINDSEYHEKTHRYEVSNGLSLVHALNDVQEISYNLFFESNNRDNYHLESYNVSITWNQQVYRNFLNYQVSPYLEFARIQNFVAVPGIIFNINFIF